MCGQYNTGIINSLGKYCQKLQFFLYFVDVWWEGFQLSVWNWLFSTWTTCSPRHCFYHHQLHLYQLDESSVHKWATSGVPCFDDTAKFAPPHLWEKISAPPALLLLRNFCQAWRSLSWVEVQGRGCSCVPGRRWTLDLEVSRRQHFFS